MPATVTADRAVAGDRPSHRRPPGTAHRLVRACDAALDASVVVLATWTVTYHVCLLLDLTVAWSVAIELVLLAAALELWRRSRHGAGATAAPPARAGAGAHLRFAMSTLTGRLLLATTIAATSTAAFLTGVAGSWPWTAWAWLVAGSAGTALALLHAWHRGADATAHAGADAHEAGEAEAARADTEAARADADLDADHDAARAEARRAAIGVTVALVWATGLAVLAMFTRWPNPDDLFYVNLSQWVAERGTFPMRDTIFSDLAYPMATWPPVASYDPLAGVAARLAGVHAASVVYLVVPPVATFLSVLAMWRLVRAWGAASVPVALTLALAFLLSNGGPGYAAPGNLFLTRIWQGKVILLCLLVPLLLVYALRYVAAPTRTHAAWLFAGGVAGVGLSTTGMFLVPLLALGAAAPLALRRPRLALGGFAAMAAYPLATGAVTLLVDGHSADMFEARKLFRFDPGWFGPLILRDGPIAVAAVFGVLAGALLLPRHAARITTGVLAVIVGVSFVPGVTELSYDLVGLGPTLWRVSWLTTIAALVGMLGAELGVRRRRRPSLLPALLIGALVVWWGTPIWSGSMWVTVDDPSWKRDPEEIAVAEQVIGALEPGEVVLAPQNLAVTITVTTTRVKTVAPRDYFMDYLRNEPGFQYVERLRLWNFAAGRYVMMMDKPHVADALDAVDVAAVCLPSESEQRLDFLRDEGYRSSVYSTAYTCLVR